MWHILKKYMLHDAAVIQPYSGVLFKFQHSNKLFEIWNGIHNSFTSQKWWNGTESFDFSFKFGMNTKAHTFTKCYYRQSVWCYVFFHDQIDWRFNASNRMIWQRMDCTMEFDWKDCSLICSMETIIKFNIV